MTATAVIGLDTTAPSVVWDEATGVVPGGSLRVPYVADEPVAGATLITYGRTLVLTVDTDAMSGVLPVDWPDGLVGIGVSDDVGNTGTYPGLFTVVGQPAVGGGVPPRFRRRRHPRTPLRTASVESVLRVATVAGISVTASRETRGAAASSATVASRHRTVSAASTWSSARLVGLASAASDLRAASMSFQRAEVPSPSLVGITSAALVASSQQALAKARDEEDLPFLFFDL